jgi:hypothetical protein
MSRMSRRRAGPYGLALAAVLVAGAIVAASFGLPGGEHATSSSSRDSSGARCNVINKGVPRFSAFAEDSTPSGRPGETIVIAGAGYYAPASRVEVRFGTGSAPVAAGKVDSGCSFRVTFKVPDVPPGRHRILVTLVDSQSSFRLESEHAFDVREPSPKLVAAPAWMRRYCASAARAIGRPILCPGALPDLLGPTENLGVLRPSRSGYLFEGVGLRHWAFAAFRHLEELQDFGPPRSLGSTRVRGRPARWLYAPPEGGIFAGHLILAWEESGLAYAFTVHTSRPNAAVIRKDLRRAAGSVKTYSPRRTGP